jgi:hypothetical protein
VTPVTVSGPPSAGRQPDPCARNESTFWRGVAVLILAIDTRVPTPAGEAKQTQTLPAAGRWQETTIRCIRLIAGKEDDSARSRKGDERRNDRSK